MEMFASRRIPGLSASHVGMVRNEAGPTKSSAPSSEDSDHSHRGLFAVVADACSMLAAALDVEEEAFEGCLMMRCSRIRWLLGGASPQLEAPTPSVSHRRHGAVFPYRLDL